VCCDGPVEHLVQDRFLLSDSYCPFGKSFPLRYQSSESVEGAIWSSLETA